MSNPAPSNPAAPAWAEHAIWWHVYPLGFAGAPIREPDPAAQGGAVVHRLRALIPWLDHLIGLGANGLLLGPIFAAEQHGYDTLDHFRIDPRLGDDEDFDALLAACRERGIRVLLDGVFNHVGAGHPAMHSALEHGPEHPDAALFAIDWRDRAHPTPHVFEGHSALVELDHTGDAAAALVGDVMRHWLRRGIDGWRLDAAYAVEPAFWARVLPAVRAEFPEAWFLGEVIHGDYAGIVRDGGLDSITQYELWKAIWSSLADRNFFELAWALDRHGEWLGTFLPQTFVGNHDVTRIATQVGEAKAVLALVVLMTAGGIPSIYAGDEFAFRGEKRHELGGDDEVRPPFPASPAEIALGDRMLREHQALIAVRRQHPWLVRARIEQLELENERFRYRACDPDGGGWIEAELALADGASAILRDARGAELYRFA